MSVYSDNWIFRDQVVHVLQKLEYVDGLPMQKFVLFSKIYLKFKYAYFS